MFTDEKLFTVEQAYNHQNNRSWSAEAPGTSAIVEHRQNPQSVMVWGGICASGKTPLVSVDQGVKINQEVYRRNILETVVLPWAQQHFGDVNWTFQQDSQGENDSILVSDPFSGLHRVFGMAALLAGSQPDGLQRMVNIGGQGLCYTPHKFGIVEAIAAPGMGSIVARRPAAHR